MDENMNNNNVPGGYVPGPGTNPDPLGQPVTPVVNQDPLQQNNAQGGAGFSQSSYVPQGGFGQDPYGSAGNFNQSGMNTNSYQQNNFQQGGYQQGAYQQNGYQQANQNYQYNNGYDQQYYQPQPSPGFSIASMIVGIISLVLFCCLNKWDLIIAIPAIILGIIGLVKEPNGKGFAIAGIITGAIALIITVIFIIALIVFARQLAIAGGPAMSQLWRELIEEAMQNQ